MNSRSLQFTDSVCQVTTEMTTDGVQSRRKLPATLCRRAVSINVVGHVRQISTSMIAANFGVRLRREQLVAKFTVY